MSQFDRRTLRWPRILLIAIVLCGPLKGIDAPVQAAQISEESYTSPTFGYSIAWPLPWYQSEEYNDGTYDTLLLADDVSNVQFSGALLPNDSPQQLVEVNAEGYRTDSRIAGFEQLPEVECAFPTDGYVACYRFDATFDDGSVDRLVALFEARSLGDGVLLIMIAHVPEPWFAEYLTAWQGFAVAGAGEPVPTVATGDDWESIAIGEARFRIEPGVSALDRDLAIEGIELARRSVQALTGPLGANRLTVTVRTGASPFGPDQYAYTHGNAIFVYTGSDSWPLVAPIERIQGLVHEYFHIYQFDRLDEVETRIPAWFLEGSAETFGFLVASELGITDQIDFIRVSLYRIGENPVPGTLCSHNVSDDTFTAEVYSLAHLAMQDLLARNGQGVGALVQVFDAIANGATFEAAFTDTFHQDVAQFCTGVESWRATLARVEDVPADLMVYEGQDLPSEVVSTTVPVDAHAGDQVIFTAQTTAGSNCSLSLSLDKRHQITRETFANGSGEAFWLVIVPEDTAVGVGVAQFSCGQGIVRQQFTIT